jgi:pilus assembly protein Flp/PilA
MTALMQRFLQDEAAATAIEYGLIVAAMGVGVITAYLLLGNNLVGLFGFVRDQSVSAMD